MPLKGSNWGGWTDRYWVAIKREGVQDLNAFAPALVLILGANRVIPLFDLIESDGRDVVSKEWR